MRIPVSLYLRYYFCRYSNTFLTVSGMIPDGIKIPVKHSELYSLDTRVFIIYIV